MRMSHDNMLQYVPASMPGMTAELPLWRNAYPLDPCFSEGLEFERYLPTFAFAQRTFVPGLAFEPGKLPAKLCSTYKDSVAACDRINWNEAEMIICTTWARMHAAAQAQANVQIQEASQQRRSKAQDYKRLPTSPYLAIAL